MTPATTKGLKVGDDVIAHVFFGEEIGTIRMKAKVKVIHDNGGIRVTYKSGGRFVKTTECRPGKWERVYG